MSIDRDPAAQRHNELMHMLGEIGAALLVNAEVQLARHFEMTPDSEMVLLTVEKRFSYLSQEPLWPLVRATLEGEPATPEGA